MRAKSARYLALAAGLLLIAAAGIAVSLRNAAARHRWIGPATRVVKIERGDILVHVREVGIVEASDQVQVKSALSGRVIALRAHEGDRVTRGQALAVVEPDLAQAQSFVDLVNNLRTSRQALEDAKRHFDADRHLFAAGLLPESAYLDSKTHMATAEEFHTAAERKYRLIENSGIRVNEQDGTIQTSAVRAPIDGVILARSVAEGETVVSGVGPLNAGTVLFTIAGSGAMKIKTAVSELHVGKVAVGQEAAITIDSYPGLTIPARVRWIAPAIRVDEKARVFDVELELSGEHPQLRNGMSVNVDIAGTRRSSVRTLPVEAIFERGAQQFVYLYQRPAARDTDRKPLSPAQYFVQKPVTTGLSDGNRIEIVSGPDVGATVALEPPGRTFIGTAP